MEFSFVFISLQVFHFLPRLQIKPNFCSNTKHASFTKNILAIITFDLFNAMLTFIYNNIDNKMNCEILNQAVYLNNSYNTNTDTQFYSTNFNKSQNISKYKNKNYTYRRLKSAATIPPPRAVRAWKFRPQQTRLKCSTRVPISNVPPYQIAFSPSPPLVLSWNASESPPTSSFISPHPLGE